MIDGGLRALREIRRVNGQGFTGLLTGRTFRAAVMRRLQGRGLVASLSMVVCDGDGFTKGSERWRMGWVLTAAGKRALLRGEA